MGRVPGATFWPTVVVVILVPSQAAACDTNPVPTILHIHHKHFARLFEPFFFGKACCLLTPKRTTARTNLTSGLISTVFCSHLHVFGNVIFCRLIPSAKHDRPQKRQVPRLCGSGDDRSLCFQKKRQFLLET